MFSVNLAPDWKCLDRHTFETWRSARLKEAGFDEFPPLFSGALDDELYGEWLIILEREERLLPGWPRG